jgi:argininosuccinate lyase
MKRKTVKKTAQGMKLKERSSDADSLSQSPVKSWQARIGATTNELAEKFVESLSFDYRLAVHDINGSMAHAVMLAQIGLITPTELTVINGGLKNILAQIESGEFKYDLSQEDIHMAIEAALIERIGEPGRKLHTARSRNDQVALDIRLWCLTAIDTIMQRIIELQKSLVELARVSGEIIMPAYTHLQRAQPITFGHELLAYVEMLQRDRDRLVDCRRRTATSPLGSGAAAGSTLPIDRNVVAKMLGLTAVSDNSLDSISDRDFAVELVFDLSLVAMHLSRWAEQWIIYSSMEFDFIHIADQFTTGSSMMPQKRNPDMLELIRGKTGGVYGQLIALLTMLKGQPLAYNRDMQEDKRWIFTAFDTVDSSLAIAAAIVQNTEPKSESIVARLDEGFIDATSMAEYLVGRGIAFRTAHQIVGKLVVLCEDRKLKKLSNLSLKQMQEWCPQIGPDVFDALGPEHVAARYASHGAGGGKQLKVQLAQWERRLIK